MRRRYERPSAYIEEFTPNEYVAACGESGTVYNFKCDAGIKYYGNRNYHYKVVGADGKSYADYYKGLYGPCGETHKADSDGEFRIGYMDDVNTEDVNENIQVYMWIERDRWGRQTNLHCTTDLDKNHWATAKS